MARTTTSKTSTARKTATANKTKNTKTKATVRTPSKTAKTTTARKATNNRQPTNSNQSFFGKAFDAVKHSADALLSNNETQASINSSLLQKFFVDALKDIYWAENYLTKALPKMRKAATSQELKDAFEDHLAVTQNHVTRLQHVFSSINQKPAAKKCEAMNGLGKEAEDIISETQTGTATRDAALICAAQKVEHYEIATYGALAQLARTLGQEAAADLLTETLNEEKQADSDLTAIAEDSVNYAAAYELPSSTSRNKSANNASSTRGNTTTSRSNNAKSNNRNSTGTKRTASTRR